MSQLQTPEASLADKSGVLSKIIPVELTEQSTFDGSPLPKERFDAEMRRMDEEMNKFSADLMNLYGQSSSVAPASINWKALLDSPLVQGDGEDKMLRLQFDLSQFDPTDIKVEIANEVLVITALHTEKNDTSYIVREFQREFNLPKGTDPDSVSSYLSRDGVLSVQATLPQLQPVLDKTLLLEQEDQSSATLTLKAVKPTEARVLAVEDSPANPAQQTEHNAFEQKRASEHKKDHDQKVAHDVKKLQESKPAEEKPLIIRGVPSQEPQNPQRGASRLSKSSKK